MRRLVIKETEEALSIPADSESCNAAEKVVSRGHLSDYTGSPQLPAREGMDSRNTRLLPGQKNKDDVQA